MHQRRKKGAIVGHFIVIVATIFILLSPSSARISGGFKDEDPTKLVNIGEIYIDKPDVPYIPFPPIPGTPQHSGINSDGHISRTFLYHGSIEFYPHSKNFYFGGLGWYNPDDYSSICLMRMSNHNVGYGFYYEGIYPRVAVNYDSTYALLIHENYIDQSFCPISSSDSDQIVGTSRTYTFLGPTIFQSTLLCIRTYKICAVDELTAKWHLYNCNGFDGIKYGNQLKFGAGNIIEGAPNEIVPTIGSSSLIKGCERWNSGVESYDATGLLSLEHNMQQAKMGLDLDQIAPFGSGNSYILSCYSTDYFSFPQPEIKRAVSHDYFLVLDVGNQDEWPRALTYHNQPPLGPPTPVYAYHPNSILGRGIHDLSGDNDCPNDMDSTTFDKSLCQPRPKCGDTPLVVVPSLIPVQ